LAKGVQLIEKKAAPYIDHFLLAEKSYQYELPFLKDFTVLQNKYQGELKPVKPFRLDHLKRFHFIISGTITASYGIAEALEWFCIIGDKFPGSQLTVIGHVTIHSYRQKLETIANGKPGIILHLSSFPIPAEDILEAQKRADIVLLPYRQKASIRYKIPTKLFETLAMGMPVLYSENELWSEMVNKYPGGKAIDFCSTDTAVIDFEKFLAQTFYQSPPSPDLVWDDEKSRWIDLVDKLLK